MVKVTVCHGREEGELAKKEATFSRFPQVFESTSCWPPFFTPLNASTFLPSDPQGNMRKNGDDGAKAFTEYGQRMTGLGARVGDWHTVAPSNPTNSILKVLTLGIVSVALYT